MATYHRLQGPALVLARALWGILAVVVLGVFIISLPADMNLLIRVEERDILWTQLAPAQAIELRSMGLSTQFYAAYMVSLEVLVAFGFAALGLLIFWRRSEDAVALFVAAACLLFGTTIVPTTQALAATNPAWRLPVDYITAAGFASGLLLFYLFPNGRFVPSWTRYLAVPWIAWVIAWPLVPAINPDNWPLPYAFASKLLWYSTGLAALIFRYRKCSTPVERQQTKWVVFGLTAGFVGFTLFNLLVVLFPALQGRAPGRVLYMLLGYPVLAIIPLLLVPISFAFALLRYRLWQIDLIIRGTLVYGVLTLALILLYFASVFLLQQVAVAILGRTSVLAVAAATLGIAITFDPLRVRVQGLIDRAFYRRKYDADQVLHAFNTAVRDEFNLNVLTNRLLTTVEESVQPVHVSLWLRGTPEPEPADGDEPARAEGITNGQPV